MRGLGAIFAVGLRPCSGAILVLVFALAQGLFLGGIAATFVMGFGTALTVSAKGLARRLTAGSSDGRGAVVLRGLEFAAACMVLVLGSGLLRRLLRMTDHLKLGPYRQVARSAAT